MVLGSKRIGTGVECDGLPDFPHRNVRSRIDDGIDDRSAERMDSLDSRLGLRCVCGIRDIRNGGKHLFAAAAKAGSFAVCDQCHRRIDSDGVYDVDRRRFASDGARRRCDAGCRRSLGHCLAGFLPALLQTRLVGIVIMILAIFKASRIGQ